MHAVISFRASLVVMFLFHLAFGAAAGMLAAYPVTARQANQAASPALPKGVERVAAVEGITEYRLANGLRVLLFPDQSKQIVTVNITYLVGSRHENYGESGMAHLLEHLTFKGTPKHPNIYQELTEHGGQSNGTTKFDRTNYFITLPANEANLEWVIKLEADRMVNAFISKKDLETEMTVVRNEFEASETSPADILRKRVFAVAYDWHNYGNSPFGARSDIEQVPIERLQDFYRKYYRPDNAVLMLAGRFDSARALNLIAEAFGPIPVPAAALTREYTVEPAQEGERAVTIRRVGGGQIVVAAYHIPPASHSDSAAVEILSHLLGVPLDGRLSKAIDPVTKGALTSWQVYLNRDPSLLLFQLELGKDDSLDAARALFLKTIEEFAAEPPPAAEVERVRNLFMGRYATLAPENLGIQMSEWISADDWRLFFIHRDRLGSVTPADIQRVARAYLKQSNRTVGTFIPTDKPDLAEIPPAPKIAPLVENYKGSELISEGESFDPTPAHIESRLSSKTLPVGLKIAMLPKKNRGKTVSATMTIQFGDEASLAGRSQAGVFLPFMLMMSTAKHSRQENIDALTKMKSRVIITPSDLGSAKVSIQATRDSLKATLAIAAEMLRSPGLNDPEFEFLKRAVLASSGTQNTLPENIAQNAFSRALFPYPATDVRYRETLEEQLEQLKATTTNDLKRLYSDLFGLSDAQLAIVGDFDPAEVVQTLSDLFGNWKSPARYDRVQHPFRPVQEASLSFETPDKPNAVMFVGLRLNISQSHPDYPALLLANYLLGGGFLNSKLATRIRQKEGLSYDVNSVLYADYLDPYASLQVKAIFAPQNAALIETAIREEIARTVKDGFSLEEINAGKSGLLQTYQVSRAHDGNLADELARNLFLARTFSAGSEVEKKIAALTPAEVLAALRRHISPEKLTVVKAGDFAKVAK